MATLLKVYLNEVTFTNIYTPAVGDVIYFTMTDGGIDTEYSINYYSDSVMVSVFNSVGDYPVGTPPPAPHSWRIERGGEILTNIVSATAVGEAGEPANIPNNFWVPMAFGAWWETNYDLAFTIDTGGVTSTIDSITLSDDGYLYSDESRNLIIRGSGYDPYTGDDGGIITGYQISVDTGLFDTINITGLELTNNEIFIESILVPGFGDNCDEECVTHTITLTVTDSQGDSASSTSQFTILKGIYGCMDDAGGGYNQDATRSDSSCTYDVPPCDVAISEFFLNHRTSPTAVTCNDPGTICIPQWIELVNLTDNNIDLSNYHIQVINPYLSADYSDIISPLYGNGGNICSNVSAGFPEYGEFNDGFLKTSNDAVLNTTIYSKASWENEEEYLTTWYCNLNNTYYYGNQDCVDNSECNECIQTEHHGRFMVISNRMTDDWYDESGQATISSQNCGAFTSADSAFPISFGDWVHDRDDDGTLESIRKKLNISYTDFFISDGSQGGLCGNEPWDTVNNYLYDNMIPLNKGESYIVLWNGSPSDGGQMECVLCIDMNFADAGLLLEGASYEFNTATALVSHDNSYFYQPDVWVGINADNEGGEIFYAGSECNGGDCGEYQIKYGSAISQIFNNLGPTNWSYIPDYYPGGEDYGEWTFFGPDIFDLEQGCVDVNGTPGPCNFYANGGYNYGTPFDVNVSIYNPSVINADCPSHPCYCTDHNAINYICKLPPYNTNLDVCPDGVDTYPLPQQLIIDDETTCQYDFTTGCTDPAALNYYCSNGSSYYCDGDELLEN